MKPFECLSEAVGANLKRLIQQAEMTQVDAAKKLGYSDDRQIRRLIKNGVTKTDEVARIAHAFGVPIAELLKPFE